MRKRGEERVVKSMAFSQIFLLITLSFAVSFLISEHIGVVSADVGAIDPSVSLDTFIPGGGEVVSTGGAAAASAPSAITTGAQSAGASAGGYYESGKWISASGKTSTAGTGGIKGAIGRGFRGEAFGGPGIPGVGGALIQGALWGAALGLAAKMILPMFGVDEDTTNTVSAALAVGGLAGGAIKAGVISTGGKVGGFTAGKIGFAGGVVIAAVVFIALYKKEKKEVVTFQCLPWEPVLGGAKCEECNTDSGRPCSEYRCKSLGQACELLNPGTEKEQCVWVSKFDVESPTITPNIDGLRPKGLKYIEDTSVRPPALGVKVVDENHAEGCLQAFTPLEFAFTTNEPAQCKIDFNHTDFDSMAYYVGGDNYFVEEHSQVMRLPDPNADVDLSPLLRNDGSFSLFVRCQDGNGNLNEDEYSISYCVNEGPDTTPPRIEKTSIITGSPVQFAVDSVPIEVYTNEPAECSWSTQSKAYEDMENTLDCALDVSELNADLTYTCSGQLTGVEDRSDNEFYFRCKDQPGKEDKDRNVMVQSYKFNIEGSQPIIIDSVGPNGTITGGSSVVAVTLNAETSNGADEGKAICSFSDTGSEGSFVPMFNTDSHVHTQGLELDNGDYNYFFRCVDAGGNVENTETSFTVDVDKEAPKITRIYRDQALKIVTNEDAECRYSLSSCNYEFTDGLRMAYSNPEIQTSHFVDWTPGTTYYVRCSDEQGNEPNPASCSAIVRPTDIKKAIQN